MTEAKVYSQVAKLFEHHNDPLTKFVQSLLDAPNHQTQLLIIYGISTEGSLASLPIPNSCSFESCTNYYTHARHCEESSALNLKRETNVKMSSILKQSKSAVSPSTAPPAKMGLKRSSSMTIDHNTSSKCQLCPLIHKVRKALHLQDADDKFLRWLHLYTQKVMPVAELRKLVDWYPELIRRIKEYN
ncbi:Paired amphipathic helix protein Sin3a [Homalodisca vitripennis]|nr:Paired amphipathic helix protein Sin3a [Homalodisca vitripennis]